MYFGALWSGSLLLLGSSLYVYQVPLTMYLTVLSV